MPYDKRSLVYFTLIYKVYAIDICFGCIYYEFSIPNQKITDIVLRTISKPANLLKDPR